MVLGFVGLLLIAIVWIFTVIASPDSRSIYYIFDIFFGASGGILLWRAIVGWKNERSTKPQTTAPHIYTKDPPDANFPFHS